MLPFPFSSERDILVVYWIQSFLLIGNQISLVHSFWEAEELFPVHGKEKQHQSLFPVVTFKIRQTSKQNSYQPLKYLRDAEQLRRIEKIIPRFPRSPIFNAWSYFLNEFEKKKIRDKHANSNTYSKGNGVVTYCCECDTSARYWVSILRVLFF